MFDKKSPHYSKLQLTEFLNTLDYLGLLVKTHDEGDEGARDYLLQGMTTEPFNINPAFIEAVDRNRWDIVELLASHMSAEDLGWCLVDACTENNMAAIKFLISHAKLHEDSKFSSHLREGFKQACNQKNWQQVKYWLSSPEVSQYAQHKELQKELCYALCSACEDGCLEMVRYLMTSHEITSSGLEHAKLESHNLMPLNHACASGSVAVVKYLLTSPEIARPSSYLMLCKEGSPLLSACYKAPLTMVEYLMTSPDITKCGGQHANLQNCGGDAIHAAISQDNFQLVHYLLQQAGEKACEYVWDASRHNQSRVINYLWKHEEIKPYLKHEGILKFAITSKLLKLSQYLLYDLDLPYTKSIKSWIKKNRQHDFAQMFEARDLKKNLDEQLPIQPARKKMKV